MYLEILLIVIGLFAIICSILKPAFYWNSRKAMRLRRLLGDTLASAFYIVLGFAIIIYSIISIINGGIR